MLMSWPFEAVVSAFCKNHVVHSEIANCLVTPGIESNEDNPFS